MPDSPPEKLPAAMWSRPRDSSIRAELEIDAEPLLAVMEAVRATGHRLTPTAIVARAVGEVLVRHPSLNRDVRGGRVRDRGAIDVWVTMTDDEGHLSGHRVDRLDERDLLDVQQVITEKGRAHEEGTSTGSRAIQAIVRWTPLPVLKVLVRTLEFFLHTLRLPVGLLGIDREGFGAVHITNVGPFGVKKVAAPIPPITGQSVLVTVGEIHETPIVEDGEVQAGTVLPLTLTVDHRIVVGIVGGRWVDTFRTALTDAGWLVDQLPDDVRKAALEHLDEALLDADGGLD